MRTDPFEKMTRSFLTKGSRTVLEVCRQRMIGGETSGKEKAMMKNVKRMMALTITLLMCVAISVASFASEGGGEGGHNTTSTPSITINSTANTQEAATDTTQYTWYRILEADIAKDPTQAALTQSGGEVSYYVTTQDRATELTNTGLFNVVQVGTTNKWYVELKDENETAADIAAAFAADSFDLTKFAQGTFSQTEPGGNATSGTVDPGYYYISSTAGTNAVLQTLTAVTIHEKNTYPTENKIVDANDQNAQIGDDISFTLTVVIPATANDMIVLKDQMTEGLTFNRIDSVKSDAEGAPDVEYQTLLTGTEEESVALTPDNVTVNNNTFRIKFSAATVAANQGKTITIHYTAVLNNKAVPGTPSKNSVILDYGTHYTSTAKETETYTYSFDFDKVDGDNTNTKLTGAEFKLTKDLDANKNTESGWIELVEVVAGKEYRVKMSEDTTASTTTIVTNGNTITIKGLDADETYYLVETKAPTGYNIMNGNVEVKAERVTSEGDAAQTFAFSHQDIENNKGTVLPSTGGIGTTIFYIVGAILVVIAGVLLVTRRRMKDE